MTDYKILIDRWRMFADRIERAPKLLKARVSLTAGEAREVQNALQELHDRFTAEWRPGPPFTTHSYPQLETGDISPKAGPAMKGICRSIPEAAIALAIFRGRAFLQNIPDTVAPIEVVVMGKRETLLRLRRNVVANNHILTPETVEFIWKK